MENERLLLLALCLFFLAALPVVKVLGVMMDWGHQSVPSLSPHSTGGESIGKKWQRSLKGYCQGTVTYKNLTGLSLGTGLGCSEGSTRAGHSCLHCSLGFVEQTKCGEEGPRFRSLSFALPWCRWHVGCVHSSISESRCTSLKVVYSHVYG